MPLEPGDSEAPKGEISVFGVTHLPVGAKAPCAEAGPAKFGIAMGIPPGPELLTGPDAWKTTKLERKTGVLAKRGGGTSLLGSTSFQDRWFEVEKGRFRYFNLNAARNGPLDPEKAKKGRAVEIPYFMVSRDPRYRKCFYLIPSEDLGSGRTWAMKAPTVEQADAWCSALVTNGARITDLVPEGLGEE